MAFDAKLIFKSLSPRIVAKALATLDRSTAVVVSSCWLAALFILILAVFSVHTAISAKMEANQAIAAEPVLPKVSPTPVSPRDVQMLIDRLQHQFPDIKFEVSGPALVIRCNDGAKFHQWITAMSFIDAMDPQFRWSLSTLCVGACGGSQDLMKAVVTGQKIMFALPQR